MKKTRIGVVSYLNAVPLWYSLQNDPEVEVIPDTPAQLVDLMHRGRLDVGLVPVVEALRNDKLSFFGDLGVAADGQVESVGLFTRKEPEKIRTVALTETSRTSVALTKIVLHEHGADATYIDAPVDSENLKERTEDAVLLIGDQCLRARRTDTDRVFVDLAAEWRVLTDLPFVFAVWAGPKEVLTETLHRQLVRAYEESRGISHDLIRHAAMDTGWSEADLAHYLDEVIVHRLTTECLKGLLEFARRASALGLVPSTATDKVLDAMGA